MTHVTIYDNTVSPGSTVDLSQANQTQYRAFNMYNDSPYRIQILFDGHPAPFVVMPHHCRENSPLPGTAGPTINKYWSGEMQMQIIQPAGGQAIINAPATEVVVQLLDQAGGPERVYQMSRASNVGALNNVANVVVAVRAQSVVFGASTTLFNYMPSIDCLMRFQFGVRIRTAGLWRVGQLQWVSPGGTSFFGEPVVVATSAPLTRLQMDGVTTFGADWWMAEPVYLAVSAAQGISFIYTPQAGSGTLDVVNCTLEQLTFN